MRTNFNHILHFEDDLAESFKAGTVTMEGCIPIVLLEIAKTLSIMADTLENIERRQSDAKEQTNL